MIEVKSMISEVLRVTDRYNGEEKEMKERGEERKEGRKKEEKRGKR